MSASNEKQGTVSERLSASPVKPDGESFPPVSEFGLRGGDTDLSGMEDVDDPRALERHRALMSPAAKMRRARFAKYVVGAVGFSLAVCAAAVVKTALPAAPAESITRVAFGTGPGAPSAALDRPTPEPTARPESPSPAFPTVESPSSAVADPQPAPSAAVIPSATASPLTSPASGAGAIKQREASRFALERGDLGSAVAAGERSVALDPTDGEAWLILGAAYQASGELAEAKRCYRACVAQARRGPKGECQAMSQGQ